MNIELHKKKKQNKYTITKEVLFFLQYTLKMIFLQRLVIILVGISRLYSIYRINLYK